MSARNRGHARTARGWEDARREYACLDGARIEVLRRTACVRDLDEQKTVPDSAIGYARDRETRTLGQRITVSGVEFDWDMGAVLGGPDGIRTLTLPGMVRALR